LAVTVGADGESLRADADVTAASVLTDLVAFAFVSPAAALVDICAEVILVGEFVTSVASLGVDALERSDVVDATVVGRARTATGALVHVFAELIGGIEPVTYGAATRETSHRILTLLITLAGIATQTLVNIDASFAVIAEFVSARTGDSGWTGTCPGGCRGGGNIRFRCFRCFRFGFATVSAQFVDAYFQLAAEVVLLDALVYILTEATTAIIAETRSAAIASRVASVGSG